MYKKLLVLHHLIFSKDYVAYFADQLLQFTDQIVVNCRPTNNYRNFCNIKFVHFSLWSQYLQFTCTKEIFSVADLTASLQKCVLQIRTKSTGRNPYGIVVSKKIAWHICMGATVNLLGICRTLF